MSSIDATGNRFSEHELRAAYLAMKKKDPLDSRNIQYFLQKVMPHFNDPLFDWIESVCERAAKVTTDSYARFRISQHSDLNYYDLRLMIRTLEK